MSGWKSILSDGEKMRYVEAIKTEFVLAIDDGGPGVTLCISMTNTKGVVRQTILTEADLIRLVEKATDFLRQGRN